jgi:hypothetical protein
MMKPGVLRGTSGLVVLQKFFIQQTLLFPAIHDARVDLGLVAHRIQVGDD